MKKLGGGSKECVGWVTKPPCLTSEKLNINPTIVKRSEYAEFEDKYSRN